MYLLHDDAIAVSAWSTTCQTHHPCAIQLPLYCFCRYSDWKLNYIHFAYRFYLRNCGCRFAFNVHSQSRYQCREFWASLSSKLLRRRLSIHPISLRPSNYHNDLLRPSRFTFCGVLQNWGWSIWTNADDVRKFTCCFFSAREKSHMLLSAPCWPSYCGWTWVTLRVLAFSLRAGDIGLPVVLLRHYFR
jgi:hypothetical protein